MKKLILLIVMTITFLGVYSQGRNISLRPKIKEPITLMSGETLNIGDIIAFKMGSGENDQFNYIQVLNGANEPIGIAGSRFAFRKEKIVFFKEQNGLYYAFSKYFVINIEAAIAKNEIQIIKQ